MAYCDRQLNERLAGWTGMMTAYIESMIEAGERHAEVDPELLRAMAMLPAMAPANRPPPAAVGAAAEPAKRLRADPAAAQRELDIIAEEIAHCTRCGLHGTRTKTVPGQGHPTPDIVFIGEGPGADEDQQGLAFVGRAGQLLTRLIEAMGLTRDEVFIANIVKCRPTIDDRGQRDRPPSPEEMATCLPYLKRQIAALQPRVLVLLGNVALDGLFGFRGITRHRGRWLEYEGIPTMPTFHPSFLLRGGGEERGRYWDVWDDMCAVLDRLGRKPPVAKKRPANRGGRAG